ncbi:MAG: hypothetical protein ACLR9J_05990, partial [Eubacterium sp.]
MAQENNMTGSHKKQRYYETVPRTVSPKFVARFVRQIWSILSQVRAKNIRVTQENNMTGSHKKQRYYETV